MTVVRTDLGFASSRNPEFQTVFRFFNTPEEGDLKCVQSFLSYPIVFQNDLLGLVRTFKWGLHDEATLFDMDFAVNRRDWFVPLLHPQGLPVLCYSTFYG